MTETRKLSIVIPAYNEGKTIHLILDRLRNVELNNGFQKEIIIVNDCSTDNTEAVIQKFIKENPETVRRYVRAHVEAVHLMKVNREIWSKVLGKYVKVDKDIMDKSHAVSVTEDLFPRKQYPSLEAIKTALEDIADEDPKAKALKPESFVDMSFIAELDKSGYIDNLYKRN